MTAISQTSEAPDEHSVLQWQVIVGLEHDEIKVPPELIFSRGNIDLYDEVLSKGLFKITARGRGLILHAGPFVGLIPLNERVAIEIKTRVPVSNLERMLFIAGHYGQHSLPFISAYQSAKDVPVSILDVIADNLISAVEGLRNEGLYQNYVAVTKEGQEISGRIFPLRSLVRRKQTGLPIASFSKFERTSDVPVNVCILTALALLLELYGSTRDRTGVRRRLANLSRAAALFDGLNPDFALRFLDDPQVQNSVYLPSNRPCLVAALRMSVLVVRNWGVHIRERGDTQLPAITINMEDAFEAYVRNILRDATSSFAGWQVLNGEKWPPEGAKGHIFRNETTGDFGNSVASPDTVIKINHANALIVETKYKPSGKMPVRSELDQVIAYGLAYNCRNVVLAYPSMKGGGELTALGEVSNLKVWTATLALGASDFRNAEDTFVEMISNLARESITAD
jgi:5-methylcytosine-specific restriction enzyme subunit McrC